MVESLSSLYELNLHENNWYCDCNIYDLRKWMSAQKFPFIYSPICHQPIRLKGKPWKIIEIDEFACKPKISSIKGELFYEGKIFFVFFFIDKFFVFKVKMQAWFVKLSQCQVLKLNGHLIHNLVKDTNLQTQLICLLANNLF